MYYTLVYCPDAESNMVVAQFPGTLPLDHIKSAVRGMISGLHKAAKKAGSMSLNLREYRGCFRLRKIDK